ncbi:MAG: hypothetical protein Ta2B_08050 [Termitinemataceae bacterium]|nr:MAG: hypothetical protein Ta2B_08050 [Termitinemataceae bacterium]
MTNNLHTCLKEYLHAKGIITNGAGNIHCLWHDDHDPSCKVNDTYLYCFTCNESGNIYKAAAALIGVPNDKDHFKEIIQDIESTLGIVNDWTPAKRKKGEPKANIKLSQSAVYREALLQEFAAALDGENLELAFYKAVLLLALFMMPDASAPVKQRWSLQDKLAVYGIRGEHAKNDRETFKPTY